MNVLVPIKWVVDPYVRIQIDPKSRCVKTANVKMTSNPFDAVALEQALRIRECCPVQATNIIIVTIGNMTAQEALRHGLALGADRALHILTDESWEPLSIAKILQKVVIEEAVDVVFMGKQAIDGDHNQTGQMLAALLDWPQLTFASKLQLQDSQLTVTRDVDGGVEILTCNLPAVVTVDLHLNEPRYATLPNIVRAKHKPIKMIPLPQLKLELSQDLEQVGVSEPPLRPSGITVSSAAELVGYLKNKEQVI